MHNLKKIHLSNIKHYLEIAYDEGRMYVHHLLYLVIIIRIRRKGNCRKIIRFYIIIRYIL